MNHRHALTLVTSLLVGFTGGAASAQDASKMGMTTDIPPSITTPNSVETRIGTLKFFDGFPDKATVEKVYDNLDFQRGVQAYLTALPAVSIEGARRGVTGFGSVNQTVLISEQLLDSKSLFLTANTTTPYSVLYLDSKDGPLVLEIPPEVLGPIDDAWFHWVSDVGFTGPDKGDRKSTRLNSSHTVISYAVFCLKKKKMRLAPSQGSSDVLHRAQTGH